MNVINGLTTGLLGLVSVGVGARVIYCVVMMMTAEDGSTYKKRIVYALAFLALALTLTGTSAIIAHYYG